MPGIFLFLISLYLLTACIHGTCVDILSGCKKACSTNGDCDVSTGYYCRKQLCQGKHQLKAELHGRNVSLTWRDFKPPGYQFEYIVTISTSLNNYHMEKS
uniref:EGF-like domain-containing protein n=1 Tax=Magallana gigas TaxID=29159 RepID=A0A8W8I8T6_MAGGI